MNKLKTKTWAKVLAFLLVLLLTATVALGGIGAWAMVEAEVYTVSESAFRTELLEDLAIRDAAWILGKWLFGTEGELVARLHETNIVGVTIQEWNGDGNWGYSSGYGGGAIQKLKVPLVFVQHSAGAWPEFYRGGTVTPEIETIFRDWKTLYQVTLEIPLEPQLMDEYYYRNVLVTAVYALRFWLWPILAAALVLDILCFAFLLSASGRKKGMDGYHPGWGTKVPLDLLTALLIAALGCLAGLADEVCYGAVSLPEMAVLFLLGETALTLVTGWCMSLRLRFQLGTVWKNTVIAMLLRGLWRLVTMLPLIWKTALGVAVVTALELAMIAACWMDMDAFIFFWITEKILLIPAVLYIALMLRTLQKGGEAVAAGDLSQTVDTRRMLPDFKAHGENLNRMSQGIALAVEQRMKSERMKTELITNVSHDLKTPLTSIISYSDLICREQTENENITEYAEVLHRQSERLKRLLDDLVEASKVSTGNLDVQLAPVDLAMVLNQTAGEYAERLQERGLELLARQTEGPAMVLADGRRLGRILDNLMTNAMKYAMPGTRVYLTLEQREKMAVLTLRNTSREPLELSAEEFTERFVRGDHARSGEGSGLGLSIAKSLTELQGGVFDLVVDGDLFKVSLRFPVTEA